MVCACSVAIQYRGTTQLAVADRWRQLLPGRRAHDWGWGVIPARSFHPGGVNAALGDGSVRFISNTVDLLTYQRLGAVDDGNAVANF